jgi:sodium transport system ATP-binding protein
MIIVENISKKFRDLKVLENINFEVKEGEIFGLLGLNGAGKTTILRILSTTISPSSGTARICGYDILKDSLNVRKIIGVLPSEINLYNRFTPKELIILFSKFYEVKENIVLNQILKFSRELNMEEYINRKIENFSSGMKRKTAILFSFVYNRSVLLLDEPTSSLDITSAKIVRDFIKKFRKEKNSIIICSHNLTEIEDVCDKIGIIHRGKIVVQGKLDELKKISNLEKLEDIFIKYIGEKEFVATA